LNYPLKNLRIGLEKTKQNFFVKIKETLGLYKGVSAELLDKLGEILIKADVGPEVTSQVINQLEKKSKQDNIASGDDIIEILKKQITAVFDAIPHIDESKAKSPRIIMVVGVNGTGKTTTIAKLAQKYKKENKKVLLAACDTFRAAAIEQLAIWANRVGVDMIKAVAGADPAAVAFDAITATLARKADVLIVDTAGRLHTKSNLMEELKKIKKVMSKVLSTSPQEILLVLDATVGQNALSQVKLFDEAVGLTGIILAKLDGTAKGGIVIAIADKFKIPIRYIGIGEKMEDLEEFHPRDFVEAIFND
jgi:fused signal recognition particle receptor